MKVFVYCIDDVVCVGTSANQDLDNVAQLTVPDNVEFLIMDSSELPSEPQESWELVGSEIQINQDKLIEYYRENLPPLTKRQFILYLDSLKANEDDADNTTVYDEVLEYINQDKMTKLEFENVFYIERTSPTVETVSQYMNWNNERLNQMWNEALTL